MAKERRCNLFDDHGKPRRRKDGTKGCHRDASVCHFAHPHEREWKTASPSHPPRHDTVVDSDSEFYYITVRDYRDREKGRERELERRPSSSYLDSPPRPRDSTTTRASPGPPSRRSTFDSVMDGSGAAKRGRSPAPSSSSDRLETSRKDNNQRRTPPSRWDQPHPTLRRTRSRSRDKDKDRQRADLPGKIPPARSHVSGAHKTDTHHPSTLPPQPSQPPPMQPPSPPPQVPGVPKVPSFASNQQPASSTRNASRGRKELSMDEQRSAWHERIDLMFTSITSRRDYANLESDLSQMRLLSASFLVSNMPEADRARIHAQQSELEHQMDVKRKEINDTVQKLIGSNFWPVLRTPQISEMEKTLEQAKRHVSEVRSLLDDVSSSSAALLKTSAADRPQDLDRPHKRRRLEEEVDTPERIPDGPINKDGPRELDMFRDKLTELDRHLIDLENVIVQRDSAISDEIELQIDAWLEEEGSLYLPVKEPAEVCQAEIEAVINAKNDELVRAVATTGEEVKAMAVEIAELIMKVDALEARCRALEAENQEFKSKFNQDTVKHAQSQDALVRRDKEIEAMATALRAYISQAPACPTASDLPSGEYVIESLRGQLDGLVRDKFRATIDNIQREFLDKVRENHNRTLETVSPKIALLLGMVNLITARLGRPDMEAVNTV